jgi:Cellulase (glycosyl hydrolase family 5)
MTQNYGNGRKYASVLVAVLLLGLSARATPRVGVEAAGTITGLHVSGNQILNGSGQPIRLLGVDRSGSEYACIQGWGMFDGPSDATSVQAIASWHANAVRVPLNEDCWLGINGASAAYSGTTYQQAIANYVNLLNQNGLVAILDLHWNAPGTAQATGQVPMPDQDHAPAFWQSVANYFKGNSSVIFDLFNEPYPDSNQNTTAAWQCLRDGGTCPGISYQAAGMQELVTSVRNTGATNIIMVGGVGYSGILSQWLSYKPIDPLNNLAASWHSYNFSWCNTPSCWDSWVGPVAQQVPVVTGEIGENDCAHGYIDSLMQWLDGKGQSYLGWAWNTANCSSFPALITNYNGSPTGFGVGFQTHLAGITGASASPTPTGTQATGTPSLTSTPGSSPTPTTTPSAVTVTVNSAAAVPTTVASGGSSTLSATVTSSAGISTAIIDFEIYNSANTKVYQTYQSANLVANTAQSFTAPWPVPATQAPDRYTLKVGVFNPTWSTNYAWNDAGATITVSTAQATATATNTPQPTAVPKPTATPKPHHH